jgi:hypothetical protein
VAELEDLLALQSLARTLAAGGPIASTRRA